MDCGENLPTLSRARLVLFDFDFTLADSSKGVVECINFAFGRLGLARAPEDRIRRTIGLSLRSALPILAGGEMADRTDEFVRLFVQRANEVMADLTHLFDDAPGAVMRLKERGYTLGIVSTKFRYRIAEILRRERLTGAFDVIVGGEDVSAHKPDPEGVFKAVSQTRYQSDDTVYVGDSLVDAETAQRAGLPFIAVLTGTTTKDDFAGYPLAGALENLAELPPLLASWR
jgi:phosphoglycolate phosphatase